MKWILFMTLLHGGIGASVHTVEFNREEDCWAAAKLWVSATETRRTQAHAYCTIKR